MRTRITPRADGLQQQERGRPQQDLLSGAPQTAALAVQSIREALAITTEDRLRRMNAGLISYTTAVLRNSYEQERPMLEALARRIADTHQLMREGLGDLENPARRILTSVRRFARQLSGRNEPPALEDLFDEQLSHTQQLLDYATMLVEEKRREATAIDQYAGQLIESESRAHGAAVSAQTLLPEYREQYEQILRHLATTPKDDASYYALKHKARRTYWEGRDLSHAQQLAVTKERTILKSQSYVEEVLERLLSYTRNVELFVETAATLQEAVAHTKRGYFSVVESQRNVRVLRDGMRCVGEQVEQLHEYLRASDTELRTLLAGEERARLPG